MTTTLATRPPRWTRVSDEITSGAFDGNYAGVIERMGPTWEARDAFGALVGRFDTEDAARAAFEPAALTASWNAHARRERIMATVGAVAGAATTVMAAIGLLTLTGH
jgi:hypothetical protein